jgi:3-phenylpropionate/trans-cinnamate dioxygenase ferredoxin subunit
MAVRVCAESQLALENAIKVVVDGVAVTLVKDSAGNCYALGDMCSHSDISLADGFVEGDDLECWAHGGRFELKTGRATMFPATEPVPVYQLTIRDGDIWVDTAVTIPTSAA